MTIDLTGTTALITGASSGIGTTFADTLARRGADVVLVARRADRLAELAQRIEREHGVQATAIPLDLTRSDAAPALRAELDARGLKIQTLVNNAGFGMKGPLVSADAARVAELVQLNVVTLVALTREFLPDLTAAGRGALVNIASTAAYQPLPDMAAYGASKAFVLSFTEAVAYETRASGLRVLALSPGATRTEFFDVVGNPDAAVGGFQTPEEVVGIAMNRLDRKRTPASVVAGRMNAFASGLASALPRPLTLAISARALRGSGD